MERGEYIVDLTSVFDFYGETLMEIKSKQFEQVLGCPLKEEIIRCKDCKFYHDVPLTDFLILQSADYSHIRAVVNYRQNQMAFVLGG